MKAGKIAFNNVEAFDFETGKTWLSGFWPTPLLPQLGMFLWVNLFIWQIHGVYCVVGIVLGLYEY